MSFIKNDSDIKNHLSVDATFRLATIASDIKEVEADYIIPALGKAQYKAIDDIYNAPPPADPPPDPPEEPTELSEYETKLLDLCQEAIVNLAMAKGIITGRVSFQNQGIRMIEDGTYKTAYRYMYDELIEKFQDRGFNYIDKMLAYLEENATQGDPDAEPDPIDPIFKAWMDDPSAYTINKQHYLRSAGELQAYIDIKNSRRTFLAIVPTLKTVEDFFIEFVLGKDLHEAMLVKIKDATIKDDADLSALLLMIQPAAVYLTMGTAIDTLSFSITDNGMLLKESMANSADGGWKGSKPDETIFARKKESLLQTGNRYLDKLKDFLNENTSATKYPEYFNSDRYHDPAEVYTRPNSGTKIYRT